MPQYLYSVPVFYGVDPVSTMALLTTAVNAKIATLVAGSYTNMVVRVVPFITTANAITYGASMQWLQGTNS